MTILAALINKLPDFDPSWPSDIASNWFDAFAFICRVVSEQRRQQSQIAAQMKAVDLLLMNTPQQVREDIRQEVAIALLSDGRQSLQPLVRQMTSKVLRAHDLKFKTISLETSIGENLKLGDVLVG